MPYLQGVSVSEDEWGQSLSLDIRLFRQDTTERLRDALHVLTEDAPGLSEMTSRTELGTLILDVLLSTLKQTPSSEQGETSVSEQLSMSRADRVNYALRSLTQQGSLQLYGEMKMEAQSFTPVICPHIDTISEVCFCTSLVITCMDCGATLRDDHREEDYGDDSI